MLLTTIHSITCKGSVKEVYTLGQINAVKVTINKHVQLFMNFNYQINTIFKNKSDILND